MEPIGDPLASRLPEACAKGHPEVHETPDTMSPLDQHDTSALPAAAMPGVATQPKAKARAEKGPAPPPAQAGATQPLPSDFPPAVTATSADYDAGRGAVDSGRASGGQRAPAGGGGGGPLPAPLAAAPPATAAGGGGGPLLGLDAVLADHAVMRDLFNQYEALCGRSSGGPGGAPPRGPVAAAASSAPAAAVDAGSAEGSPTTITTGAYFASQGTPLPPTAPQLQQQQQSEATAAEAAGLTHGAACAAAAHKRGLAARIVRELSMHASAEERTLYPLAYEVLPYGKAMYDKSLADDEVVRALLQYVVMHSPRTDEEWELYDAIVLHVTRHEREHMDMEERMIVAPLRAALSPEAAVRLGQDWHVAKANAPLRPHPWVPTATAAARLAHPLAGLADRAGEWLSGLTRLRGPPGGRGLWAPVVGQGGVGQPRSQ
ncbi:hypothetical protein GPECTOR_65g183 [Gonium pectorale]|uniref:Hemerythrin-like domain-containing protein n=1 Tax=Gonium pectorale TaxID=33097 RepID=A0A150G4V5_GONPE|nr:hypothetical protein GPECTOR_65g183 [Gonium pectorale]|eukprot:KXZ44565.1 hypothetical protein GPECTOR_65g183 [Gonium pectorale]